jgi:rhodanese-related sulfurtransferase
MNWTWIVIILAIGFLIFIRRGSGVASAETVAALVKQKAQVIDVRTPEEYQDGHLVMAVNIPLAQLAREISRVEPDQSRPLLLHCASGMRSAAGKKTLEKLGYTHVHNLGSYARSKALLNPAR